LLKQRARTLTGAVLIAEGVVWVLAFFAAYYARAAIPYFDQFGTLEPWYAYDWLIAAAPMWVAYAAITGVLGPGNRVRPPWDELSTLLVGTGVVASGMVAELFVLKLQIASRLLVAFYALFGLVGVAVGRVFVRWLVSSGRTDLLGRNVAIVGEGDVARRVAESVRAHGEWGLRLAGFISVGERAPTGPYLGSLHDIAQIVERHVIDEVIFAGADLDLQVFEEPLAICDEAGVNTRIVLDFFPHKISRMDLDDFDGFPTLAFNTTSNAALQLAAKRVFDIIVSVLALIVGAPLFVLVALAIKVTMPGPVLYVSRRVGLNGREFDFYKFRTMVVDAQKLEATLRDHNHTQGPTFKMDNDPRVTPLGHFLRKTSLDEIPQFYNVLRGEMSIVGPRPLALEHSKAYERWQRRRLSVKPGLTCIWQVSGRSNLDFDTWMRLDLQYIDSWSLWLDLRLFVLTIPAVLFARGAR
jgi:exopolysaccharide biosynthesis polyprenyl glycosylphosphotransferase